MKGTKNAIIVPHGEHISVDPMEVVFPDIKANMRYTQTIVVRNLSPLSKRIRFIPPSSGEFRLIHENKTSIGSGLRVSIDIEFLTRTPMDYRDRLFIVAEDYKLEVPLIAKVPSALVHFPTQVDFGIVTTKRTHQKEIRLRNDGEEAASFELSTSSGRLKFSCNSGRLAPRKQAGNEMKIKLELCSDAPCTVADTVDVKLEGLSSFDTSHKIIDVNGTVVNQALHVFKDSEEVSTFDFGNVYHGQSKVINVMLVNDGPVTCNYSAQIIDDSMPTDVARDDSDATAGAGVSGQRSSGSGGGGGLGETAAKIENPITVSPFQGQVPAFGKIPLELAFSPAVFNRAQGFISTMKPENESKSFSCTGRIECEELSLTISVKLSGKALSPALRVSPDHLEFGECPVNQRRDIVLRISNSSDKMPLDFSIPRVPFLTINPMQGRLVPLQNQNVVVSYTPKALGKFNQDLVIKYCGNLYSHTMRCYGHAPIIGDKKIPTKGLERTGRDFDPEHVFVNPENLTLDGVKRPRNVKSLTAIMKTDLNSSAVSADALQSLIEDLPEPTPYSLSPSAMQEHVQNRQKYNRVIKESRAKRKFLEKWGPEGPPAKDIFCTDDVDKGMVPGSGLKSPRYSVQDIKPEKLLLQRALDDEGGVRGVTGHRYVHDENKMIKKKFKAAPTTQAEVRECSGALENWQLSLISVGPKILDFGTIYVRSQVTKSFSVFNDLPQAILMSIQYDSEELSRSSPSSQVVPSAQAAGFDITMCSAIPQSFQRQIVYMINGQHPYKLLLRSVITPVMLNMSRTELSFRFPEDSLDRTLSESLVLSNKGNAPARFCWEGQNQCFSVGPVSGIVRPGNNVTVDVIFTPPTSGQNMETYLTLKTEDGDDQSLRCSGQVQEAVCSFVGRRLDLGVLAVGLPADKSISVKNESLNRAIFHVDSVPDGVTVSPMKGHIAPEGRVELDVHVLLDRPMQLESGLLLNIRGGKAIRLPILATAVVPNIEFVEDEIDFGQLTLGAMKTERISLRNTSAVDGTMYVNLQSHPEFVLSVYDDKAGREDGGGDDGEFDASVLQAISPQQYQLAVGGAAEGAGGAAAGGAAGGGAAGGQGQRTGNLGATANGNQSPANDDEDDEEAHSQIYRISVQPNYTLQMQLTYQPTDLGTHQFEFPIVAADGVRNEGLRRVVHAEALRPRMLFSATFMDFKTKVVAAGIQQSASVQELALHNADDFAIEWEIDLEPLRALGETFKVEPSRGRLMPEQDCLVRASFVPAQPIEYKCSLDVFISPPRKVGDGVDSGDPNTALPPDTTSTYLNLRLRGQGAVPKLTFDPREIVLPTVPLDVRSRYLFHVVNEGYESLEVKYRLPTDSIRIPLSINFPEGQQLGVTKPRIPVEIVFQSARPISFCAKVEFLDNESGSYVLPVSGTTENCILTCHNYLQHNIDFYTMDGDPVRLKEKEDNSKEDGGAAPSVKNSSVSHQSIAGYGGQDTTQAEYIVRWMNGNVLRNQIENFPQDLIQANGRHLYEMIEFLSGKQVPAARSRLDTGGTRSGARNRDLARIQGLVQQYESLLNFLKQSGGLLSSIRPEHFLSAEQYLRYMQTAAPGMHRRQVDKVFYPKSVEAWLTTILQTIKIFLLNRITPRAFRALPGLTEQIDQPVSGPVGDDQADGQPPPAAKLPPDLAAFLSPQGLGDSNICSVAECILLRWLNFHFTRANRERYPPRTVCCFDTDLEDSIVLGVVIQSHVPNCNAVANMRYPCTTLEHYEENAALIIAALQEIGLSFPVLATDIASPHPKENNPLYMLLFVMFLFQNLPHYVPKTVIVFATMLGVGMTKHIELTNPSRRAITYFVQLEGSSDFVLREESVRIEPKQTVSFGVEFQSRFSRQVEAQLLFTSRREGNVHAAAMVFRLRSRCLGRRPRRTEHVAAILYESGTVDIDLENPFNEDADFQLSLREMTVCDADKNPIKSKRCEGIDPFYLSAQRVRVKANGNSKITVSFVPFDAPAYFYALLGFYDSRAGEFYYELFGKSSAPTPIDTYKLSIKAEEKGDKELILPHKNAQMERQREKLEARGVAIKTVIPDSIVYDVKLSSPYYTAEKQVKVVAPAKASTEKGGGDARGNTLRGTLNLASAGDRRTASDPKAGASGPPGHNAKLTIGFHPKEPGVYPCKVTLTSDVDIRVYQIEGTGTAPNTHCSLTFNTQARKHLTQEIPIMNPTDREWIIKALFTQQGHEWDGPREFTAKRRQANGTASMSQYPLSFKPEWVCDMRAHLQLVNQGTGETYEYDLRGIAEEPLAEEHVQIQCEAREKTSHKFLVKNYLSTPATFEVESDLVHISGASSVQVQGKDSAEYELTFQPLQAGHVTGCIMFRDIVSGHFTWYTVELTTDPPKPQQTLALTCEVRRAVAVDIQLVNPLDDVIVFEVALNGDGLLGEAEFVLAPKETATYELVFSPLQPSRKRGTAVFFNNVVGEFWYDLDLVADPAPPEELPLLQCELGRTVQTNVKIENPTGQEVVLKHRSTNKINFKVIQQRVVLPALESATVTIEYSPASLDTREEAQIFFEHPVVGQWAYQASGIGLPPTEAKQISVVAQVGRPISSTITFRNPFLETIQAAIVLESKSEKSVFSLLNKKARLSIGPLATTQIPFSFCPPSMTRHVAEISVSVQKPSLTWVHQITGVAEAPTDSTLHTFTVQARELLETTYNLTLAGLDTAPLDRHHDGLKCHLDVPQQYQGLIDSCFSINLEDPETSQRKADLQQVGLEVRFRPLRPFVALCNLVVTRNSGGRWRFDVKLEATEPEVDDTISIQSPLNKPASVAFRLCNHTSAYSEFEAFFDAESAYEFTVSPTSGVLEPSGTMGTTFIITYKPTEYGKPVQGKLIIQTEDVYWSYRVRGTHPKYTAPVIEKPRVATRLSKDVQQQMAQAQAQRRGRNFIRDNMRGPPASLRD